MKTVLLLSILLPACCATVWAEDLYPTCAETEYLGGALSGGEVVLYNFDTPASNMTLNCLSYDITPTDAADPKDMGDGPCKVPHQTEYQFRMFIRASYTDKGTMQTVTKEFDVKDMGGGSLFDVAIRLPHEATLSLVFANTGTNPSCGLQARVSMKYTYSAKESAVVGVPVLVGIHPRIIDAGRKTPTRFVFHHSNHTGSGEAPEGTFLLTHAHVECSSSSSSGNTFMSIPSQDPVFEGFGDPGNGTLVARDTFVSPARSYRVCYRPAGAVEAVELAFIRSFATNPAYYSLVTDPNENGHVYIYQKTTLKFYGSNLDTRPKANFAKFVPETENCDEASAAGGVPETIPLLPSDSYGPQTTSVLWSWVLKESGAYKVCYKRPGLLWVEVPGIDIVNSAGNNITTNDTASYPQPVDPVTKEPCPTAPPNTPETPWHVYSSVMLVLKETTVPATFMQKLSKILCVPRSVLAATRFTRDESGHQRVYITLLCEDFGQDRPCDSAERQNYIIYASKAGSEELKAAGIISVSGSKDIFALDDSTSGSLGLTRLLTVLAVCLTVIIVVGLIVHAALRYRESRQYFVNFGVEDDVDDMYISNIPAGTQPKGAAEGKDSVIEVED
uniref:Putative Golgi/lysosome glycoprotein 1 n=1 Tax=Trypanosoma congolense (strain IL3000) TaxID=1068625 RepID=G0URF0_TRYCI|nr:putative Golgi/lysosome glycoprotein 1 [Trypanosoma congolense IL3000]